MVEEETGIGEMEKYRKQKQISEEKFSSKLM